MFISTYIPVNMKRSNCAVYSEEKVFSEEKLVAAYSYLKGDEVVDVTYNNEYVSFTSSPDIRWTIPEVYLAYEAYRQASINDFSYYVVKNKEGIPQLFVSKSFKGHRLLVNAFSMRTVLLGKVQLVNKAASLIDKVISNIQAINIFDTLSSIEEGRAKFLSAVLVGRSTADESLAINPMTTLYSESIEDYPHELIQEFEILLKGDVTETESLLVVNNLVTHKELKHWPPMKMDHVGSIVELYYKTLEKKSNYVPIYDPNWTPKLYFSTNKRYLVNANTFECVVIVNQHTKDLLWCLAEKRVNSSDQLHLAWMLAKTER